MEAGSRVVVECRFSGPQLVGFGSAGGSLRRVGVATSYFWDNYSLSTPEDLEETDSRDLTPKMGADVSGEPLGEQTAEEICLEETRRSR